MENKEMYKGICQTILAAGLGFFMLSAQAAQDQEQAQPIREAIQACANKAEGEKCSFNGRMNNTVNGMCHKGPRGEMSFCAPEMGMQNSGSTPNQ
jgi:hypothetical protein